MNSTWAAFWGARVATVAVLLIAATGGAYADVTHVVFAVEATNSHGSGAFVAMIDPGQWLAGNSCVWTLAEPVTIVDRQSGAAIATLGEASVQYLTDPAVNLSFSVVAGPATTTFTINSALLSFPTISVPSGRASAAFTVTDGIDDDGAILSGLGGNGAYLAQYNGFVPGGTTFTQLIQQVNAPAMGTGSLSEEYPGGGGFVAIGTPVSNMSTQVSFSLTANDLASGTSNFEIIPEPAAALLALVGLALVRRRS